MSLDLDGVICKLLLNPVHNSAAANAVHRGSRTNSLTRLSRLQSYEATLPPKTATTTTVTRSGSVEPPNVLVRTRPSSGGHSVKGTRGSPSRPGDPASEELTEGEVRALVMESRKMFMSQPMLVELCSPVKVCGDIHGQYHDLLRLFDLGGYPPATNYLFLGDYVDRGDQSLETVCLLLAYKLRFPDNFFILRGNHESSSINRIYGFFDECKRRYSVAVWKLFTDTFNCLPVAALVEERVLCMHGGLSPELDSLDQLRRILRPTDVPDSGLICDLLWSDPGEPGQRGWGENDRGVSWTFGEDIVEQVVTKFDIDLICRAHQVVDEGYQFYSTRRLLTVFSAPNYCGEFNNAGAFLTIDEQLRCSVTQILPTYDVNVFC